MDLLSAIVQLVFVFTLASTLAERPTDPKPCPVQPPCTCDFNQIQCRDLDLTEMPAITKVNATWKTWTVDLTNNSIKTIPSRAFENVTLGSLQISHNAIESIQDGALVGSEDFLDSAFMQFNAMIEVPREIARMKNITMLSIHDNPITRLPDVMAFAPNLQFLDVGSPEMATWPKTIRSLKAVYILTLYKLPMSDLPTDAFVGLEDSIQSISMYSTHFVRIPKALQRLRKMTSLGIFDNIELTSDDIPDDAFQGMDSLTEILITNSSLSRVPNVSSVPFLRDLSLTNAPLSVWELTTLPEQPLLRSVSLSGTYFDHIPTTIRHIRSLTTLTLDGTKVTALGPSDLSGLQKLQQLSMRNSSLTTISNDAFNDTYILQALNLDFTNIPGFPRAIERLPALRFLSLMNVTVECSCAEMGWMKTWIGVRQLLDSAGECHNIRMTLSDYVRQEIPKCP